MIWVILGRFIDPQPHILWMTVGGDWEVNYQICFIGQLGEVSEKI